MTEERLIEFVDKMVVADQTKLVETILSLDYGPSYDDIIYPEVVVSRESKLKNQGSILELWEDEEEIEIYAWKLIDPWYVDIVEEGDMPYFQFRGQTWLGKTTPNVLTEWEYLKGLCKEE